MNLETTETVSLKSKNIFLNRNFVLLFSGNIISQLGDQIYAFSLSWFILDITKSSLQMASFLIVNALVVAMVSPFGGIFADHFNRKRIMVWMDIIRGSIVLIAALLLYNHLLQIWMLYINLVILAFCGAIFSPAALSIIPNIVDNDQLTDASSMNQFVSSFCNGTGILISGILYNLIGIFSIFILNSLSYFISSIMEACVNIPNIKQKELKSAIYHEMNYVISELNDGYQYIKKNKLVYYLTLMFAIFNLIAFTFVFVFMPYIFNVILRTTPFQLAVAQSGGWIGLIIGSILVPIFLKSLKFIKSIFWGLLIYSICIFIMALTLFPQLNLNFDNWRITIVFTVAGVILGVAITFFVVTTNVIFQKYVADEFRGRFWGLLTSIINFAMPIGFFVGGFLAQRVFNGFLLIGDSIIMLIMNLWVVNKIKKCIANL